MQISEVVACEGLNLYRSRLSASTLRKRGFDQAIINWLETGGNMDAKIR